MNEYLSSFKVASYQVKEGEQEVSNSLHIILLNKSRYSCWVIDMRERLKEGNVERTGEVQDGCLSEK